MSQDSFEMFVSVLGIKEGAEWSVVALEMDIWAHGATIEAARRELSELIAMQITFALQKGQEQIIYKAAEPRYFEMYHRVHEEFLKSVNRPQKSSRYRALGMPIHLPPKGQRFDMQHATA